MDASAPKPAEVGVADMRQEHGNVKAGGGGPIIESGARGFS